MTTEHLIDCAKLHRSAADNLDGVRQMRELAARAKAHGLQEQYNHAVSLQRQFEEVYAQNMKLLMSPILQNMEVDENGNLS